MVPRVLHRVGERERVVRAAEAHEDDLRTVVGRPQDPRHDIGIGAGAVGAEDLDRHDVHARVADAGHADAVVHVRGGDARERGAVSVRVDVRIPARFARASDDASGEIGMARVDARVEDGDGRAAGDRHIRVRQIPLDLRKGPLLRVRRVTRVASLAHRDRRSGVLDGGEMGEGGEDPVGRAGGNGDDPGPELIEGAGGGAARATNGGIDVAGGRGGLELDEEGDGGSTRGWRSYLFNERCAAGRRVRSERRGAAHREQRGKQHNR